VSHAIQEHIITGHDSALRISGFLVVILGQEDRVRVFLCQMLGMLVGICRC